LIKEALDPEEITKLEIADEADEAQEKINQEVMTELNKKEPSNKN